MPYKSEKIKIAGTKYDKRRKLSPDQAKAIKLLKGQGYSYRQLAAMFNCSKWTVQNIVIPQMRKAVRKYSTEYWTNKKREYRQRKQKLFTSGKIKETKKRKK